MYSQRKTVSIVSHVEAVENVLNMNGSTEIFEDMTDKSLKVAEEMFLYPCSGR